MWSKAEVPNMVKQFYLFIFDQFHQSIRMIRPDNGSEFSSLNDFLIENAVVQHHSCVETLQQNGVVERKHQHILHTARSLLF